MMVERKATITTSRALQTPRRRKIMINTHRQVPNENHHRSNEQVIWVHGLLKQQTQQFDKLLEITSRCVDYYNQFMNEKQSELKIIQQAFLQLQISSDTAFTQIIKQATQKKYEIQVFLKKKQQQLLNIKIQQQKELKKHLDEIKSIHLTNLLRNDEQINKEQQKTLKKQLKNYAQTLNKFYITMQQLQKNNFKQIVEQSIQFINNLISEEIKTILYEKMPLKYNGNLSFSFNHEQKLEYKRIIDLNKSEEIQDILLGSSFDANITTQIKNNEKIIISLQHIKQQQIIRQQNLNKLSCSLKRNIILCQC